MVAELSKDGYFLKLFNGIADAVFISERLSDGRPGRYVEVNDVACELLGYTRQDLLLLGPGQLNRIALEDEPLFSSVLAEVQTRGKVLFKTALLTRDGRWIPVEIGTQLFELGGKDVFLSVARDITLREKYESSIRTLVRSTVGLTGQECLEEIVCNLVDWLEVEGACVGLLQGDLLEIRASFREGVHLPACKLSVNFVPFLKVLQEQFCIIPEGAGEMFHATGVLGLESTSCFIGSPMVGHEGQILGLVFAYSRQPIQPVPHIEELFSVIAARAAAECERMHYVKELSRREEMLSTLLSSTAEAIIGIDLNGDIVFCNASSVKILGYDSERDLVGRNFCQSIVGASFSDGELCSSQLVGAVMRGEKVTHDDSFFRCVDGRSVSVECWGHPMYQDSKLIGGVITFIDISRRKLLEKQLQHSQKMEAIGTLTGGIAHDFNNILTVISGYVGLLKGVLANQPKLLAKINKIGEAAERGSSLTHGLLAYSRKKSGVSAPIDLNRLVLKVQDIFGQIIGGGIQQCLQLAGEQLIVMADPTQIEQVLVNMATNARDAMRGRGILTIRTSRTLIDREFCRVHGYGEPGEYAVVTVEDTGVGIPKEIEQKIFDPFFTTKDTGKGTGLGLATAWGIVKQHRGYILVESRLSQGSCFHIYLPLIAARAEVQVEPADDQLIGGEESILLVEDDPLVRESTSSILTSVGYRVEVCDCAEAALRSLDRAGTPFDLILSDVVMPGMKGSDFYEELRSRTSVPVIFISGYTFDWLIEQGLVEADYLLLYKPIKTARLLQQVRNVIDNGKLESVG